MSANPQLVSREQRILSLANQFLEIMRSHPDRLEVLDALDMSRILFREGSVSRSDFAKRPLPAEVLQVSS